MSDTGASGRRLLAAFAVHGFTACGAVLGFLALQAAVDRRWAVMFAWLAVALLVDGIDGTLARAARVKQVLPRFSGDILDLVVDFLTYVMVPTYALVAGGLLPSGHELVFAALILISSAFYFADAEMKTAEGGFRGFPAVWNGVIFLFFVFRPGPWQTAAAVVVLAAATFAPIVVIHPFRVARLRALTLVVLTVWALASIATLVADLAPGPWVTLPLAATSLYLLGIGLLFGKARPAR
ncbi:CDP-alcohol phosphatidyltransferase family protein [Phreatobacter stygius]|uniref:Phosphatidylcholine synthase n=1 Tax=Phreatobacter stygius TaxID=1940610 RepID=A0A4D7BKX2_9HYPH|nr:phosphatidylcholine synthase [Phreatobacter stygius]QCI68387.1 phosphatidylcholine synthase [Phreatobacter stygius]